ncbi:unnamed protein product [Closterium sp. Naga37s-1]|nr:unnamed protein product [Closterium sp. Naga37s-1]
MQGSGTHRRQRRLLFGGTPQPADPPPCLAACLPAALSKPTPTAATPDASTAERGEGREKRTVRGEVERGEAGNTHLHVRQSPAPSQATATVGVMRGALPPGAAGMLRGHGLNFESTQKSAAGVRGHRLLKRQERYHLLHGERLSEGRGFVPPLRGRRLLQPWLPPPAARCSAAITARLDRPAAPCHLHPTLSHDHFAATETATAAPRLDRPRIDFPRAHPQPSRPLRFYLPQRARRSRQPVRVDSREVVVAADMTREARKPLTWRVAARGADGGTTKRRLAAGRGGELVTTKQHMMCRDGRILFHEPITTRIVSPAVGPRGASCRLATGGVARPSAGETIATRLETSWFKWGKNCLVFLQSELELSWAVGGLQ